MIGRIAIRNLRLRCIVGINEQERTQKQDVVVNVEMWADVAEAVRTDNVRDTVDYKVVNKEIIAAVGKSSFLLVESLASAVADICLSHERISRVRVMVEKPGALRFADSVGIELTKEKTGQHD